MAKEIRGHAMPDPDVYVPPRTDAPPVSQGNGFNSVFETVGGGGPDTGPGYAFTHEQLQSIANDWEALADRYRAAQEQCLYLIDAKGPGAEYASVNNAEKIQMSGDALKRALDKRVQYCDSMSRKFRAALSSYVAADVDNASELDKNGGSL